MTIFKKINVWWVVISIVVIMLIIAVGYAIFQWINGTPDDKDAVTHVLEFLHLQVWDWIAILIAVVSLYFTGKTFKSQERTRENTSQWNVDTIKPLMLIWYENIIRNAVRLYAVERALDKNGYRAYPSEEYLMKMQYSDSYINQISLQYMSASYFIMTKGIAELAQYFNVHISVTQQHLMNPKIERSIKENDIKALIQMNWMIAGKVKDSMNQCFYLDKEKRNDNFENEYLPKVNYIEVSVKIKRRIMAIIGQLSNGVGLKDDSIGLGRIGTLTELFREDEQTFYTEEFEEFCGRLNALVDREAVVDPTSPGGIRLIRLEE